MDSDPLGEEFGILFRLLTETPRISDDSGKVSVETIKSWEIPETRVEALLKNIREKGKYMGPKAEELPEVEMLKGIVYKKILEIEGMVEGEGLFNDILEEKICQVEALYNIQEQQKEDLLRQREMYCQFVREAKEWTILQQNKADADNLADKSRLEKQHKLECDALRWRAHQTEAKLQEELSEARKTIANVTHKLEEFQEQHQQESSPPVMRDNSMQ